MYSISSTARISAGIVLFIMLNAASVADQWNALRR
jgi:hypothetical protein